MARVAVYIVAVRAYEEFLAGERLANEVTYGPASGFTGTVSDGTEVSVTVAKV